jgi:hypothetical protein
MPIRSNREIDPAAALRQAEIRRYGLPRAR